MTSFECVPSSLFCFICERKRWISEVVSVLTSKQQVKSGGDGVLQVSPRIKLFLVLKLWCHYTSHQLVWLYNSTKHGFPSVGIACLCLIRACMCECKWESGIQYNTICFFWTKSSFKGHKSIWLAALCFISPEDFTSSVCDVSWLGLSLTAS